MRLIDAGKILDNLSGMLSSMKDYDAVRKVVNNMSAVYDVDAVVKQLEELKKVEQDREDECNEDGFGDGQQIFSDGKSKGRFEAFGEAIRIVKGGGVDNA